ncbi:MarR family winged helix-turn-helix transcriptional regulator [Nocardioides antri]|uniref:Winged helix-turn-helix transcriptional regulator n=1 Tax=Nocardioides antri TaxID=2607659 RepID=A0A5B1M5W8_9ACTN|nr:MarR family winged helix-turn-helix transcriptional regulator [Nocardioides antri]KAA1428243.1 winged helix-turn-helix transcriptional regulator [Nocardioides antri]
MTEPWLDDEQQQAWRAWLEVNTQLFARLSRELQAANGLSLQDYDVLVALTEVSEPSVRMRDLGVKLEWEKSRLSKHLARMVARGLVARRDCDDDRRGAFVEITDEGLAAIRAAAPGHAALVREVFFDGLSRTQVRELHAICRTVLDRLETVEA